MHGLLMNDASLLVRSEQCQSEKHKFEPGEDVCALGNSLDG